MKHGSLVLFSLVLSVGSSFAQTDFRFKRDIYDIEKDGWYSLTLPAEIFQHLRQDIGDLRVYRLNRKDSVEIPYLIQVYDDEVIESIVHLPAVNKSKRQEVLYLTFEIPASEKVNYLDIYFQESNFYGYATIEGSDDKNNWYELTKDQRLVSVRNGTVNYSLKTINFPMTEHRYLRVSIKSDVALTFLNASFKHRETKSGSFEKIPLEWSTQTVRNNKTTVVDVKLKYPVPVSTLHIAIDSTVDYYRSVAVDHLVDSIKTQKGWRRRYENLANGYVTSFSRNEFKFAGKLVKQIRVTISNLDNQPIRLKSVSAKRPLVKIISRLTPGENFIVYGSRRSNKPAYDLAYFKNKIPDSVAVGKLGPALSIGEEKKGRGLFENKAWLWSIMAIMIGGLGFFTIKMMRHKS